MKVISVVNPCKESGKTQTALNIAFAKAIMGRRVLLIDLDPQADLSKNPCFKRVRKDVRGLFERSEDPSEYAFSVLDERVKKDMYFVSSSLELSAAALEYEKYEAKEFLLKTACRKYEMFLFDYIIIDCPSDLGLLTTNAIAASREVLIPVMDNDASYKGMKLAVKRVEEVDDFIFDMVGYRIVKIGDVQIEDKYEKPINLNIPKFDKMPFFPAVVDEPNGEIAQAFAEAAEFMEMII